MGNSLQQNRFSIFFSKIFRFPSISLFGLNFAMKHLSRHIVVLNFYLQFSMFLLLICGDIGVNPGPIMANVLDILHLNVRSIRKKVANLNTIVHDF